MQTGEARKGVMVMKEKPEIPSTEVRAVAVPMPVDVALPGELLMYNTEDGKARIECRFSGETLWLSQAQMAELSQTTPQNITLHLKALYEEGEINKAATCKDFLQVRTEGKRGVADGTAAGHHGQWCAQGAHSTRELAQPHGPLADVVEKGGPIFYATQWLPRSGDG